MKLSIQTLAALLFSAAFAGNLPAAPAHGWLNWRGPEQNGVSRETGLPDQIDSKKPLWTADFPGASTAVVADGHVYIMGYLGDGPNLQEGVACFDAETGQELWRHLLNDYLSDIIYERYATSSPTVDPETGNVYTQGTQGVLSACTRDGKQLWSIPMSELYGRLTFPNGRTTSPVVDGDLVITRGITANWGANGPAGDRVYAFDKNTGELVWATGDGIRPMDSCFARPFLTFLDGKRVFITTTGDGSIFCANARTGEPIWVIPVAKAGINASVLVHNNDKVIAIYGTPYEPGQLIALKIPHVKPTNNQPVVVERSQVELWNSPLSTSTSSPILVGDTIYVVSEKGSLCSVDVNTGKIAWQMPIGIEQRNSCPLFADGKLYVPMLDDPKSKAENAADTGTKGAFYVIKPSGDKGEILSHAALEGRCQGTPTAYNGKVYMQTTRKFYCFGKKGNNPGVPKPVAESWPKAGPAAQLQIIPSEVFLLAGQSHPIRVRSLDSNGYVAEEKLKTDSVKFASFVPPTAKVRSVMKATFQDGKIVADSEQVGSAGAFQASFGNLKGLMRGRVMPALPLKEDFEGFKLSETTTNTVEQPTAFSYPPLPWIGARFKFDVREKDGNKALVKTIDNRFFQRATMFIGPPSLSNYTIEADVMSEGNRRKMSEVGLICQRYMIVLKGNDQKLEISSNFERLRIPAGNEPPNFKWSPNTWYHLKARVDAQPDGSGIVRAKAWKKGDPEPEAWLLEVPHKTAHREGAPGLFGFAPQDMRVYIDNILVSKNN
ncbi:MAG TPA: PQQ-binding-like beta-propeller repeat protein [Verrucomicrobiae bacterium]|nr:PQQ-binding-like beta-propeller repeat protein [Verrucomicrobiae bacterium]